MTRRRHVSDGYDISPGYRTRVAPGGGDNGTACPVAHGEGRFRRRRQPVAPAPAPEGEPRNRRPGGAESPAPRVSESYVVLENPGLSAIDHEADEEEPTEKASGLLKGTNARFHHLPLDHGPEFGCDQRVGCHRPHSSGVGSDSALTDLFVVPGCREGEPRCLVDHDDHRRLKTAEKLLHHHRFAGIAKEPLPHDRLDRGMCLPFGSTDGDSFPGGETVCLDHDGRSQFGDRLPGLVYGTTLRWEAVRIPFSAMKSLAYALLPSSCASAADGPTTSTPAARSSSARPSTRGTSGPITTRSTACSASSSG
jgi:hypothetical protein